MDCTRSTASAVAAACRWCADSVLLRVLQGAVGGHRDARRDWLWVTDLSRPETLAIRILPVTMMATQFILQKMTPTLRDPTQARVMLLMP